MTSPDDLSLTILQFFDIAVLRRVAPRRYEFFGAVPPFYSSLFPGDESGPCNEPWNDSPLLEFFLEDAELFFEQGHHGSISSGIWQESDKTEGDTALIAIAATFTSDQVIIIRMLKEEYADRVAVLRKAREQLLEHRELAHNVEIFKQKSQLDGLTQIFNRATFMELLHDEIKRSMALGDPLSLLILDIDDFKHINDTYGHLTGDSVLRTLGALLIKTLRRNDIIARYGGEEFMVLIPHEACGHAAKIGEKVRKGIAALAHPGIPAFTVSVGCTTYTPRESIESFIQRADNALYEAKRGGKNTVRVR